MIEHLDTFVQHYIAAALWSSNDFATPSGGEALDSAKYEGRLTKAAQAAMRADCKDWLEKNAALVAELEAAAGELGYGRDDEGGVVGYYAHDLWLTRNEHGAGFWDRGLGELGERLTEAAERAGTRDLYVSRGWIYQG